MDQSSKSHVRPTLASNPELRKIVKALILWELYQRGLDASLYPRERINEAVDAMLDALQKAKRTLN